MRRDTLGYLIKYLTRGIAEGGDLSGVAVSFRHDGAVVVSVHQDDPQTVLRLLDVCSLAVDDADEPMVLSSGPHVIGFARHTPGSLRTGVTLDWHVDGDGVDALAELADYAFLTRREAIAGV